MKKDFLLLAVAVLLCLGSCKKEAKAPNMGIIGKWYETKLVLHEQTGTAASHDTMFTATAFTKDDYCQFMDDKKAIFSQSGIYSFTGKAAIWGIAGLNAGVSHYTWSVTDSTLKLTSTDIFPSAQSANSIDYQLQTIVQLDESHLVLKMAYYDNPSFTFTATSYFTKEK